MQMPTTRVHAMQEARRAANFDDVATHVSEEKGEESSGDDAEIPKATQTQGRGLAHAPLVAPGSGNDHMLKVLSIGNLGATRRREMWRDHRVGETRSELAPLRHAVLITSSLASAVHTARNQLALAPVGAPKEEEATAAASLPPMIAIPEAEDDQEAIAAPGKAQGATTEPPTGAMTTEGSSSPRKKVAWVPRDDPSLG
jgi:hypothetical protein